MRRRGRRPDARVDASAGDPVVGAAAVEVVMVFVVVAWSRRVSGCPDGSGACVLLVFVVADAGAVFGLEASDREGSDGGFATECADAVLGLGELEGELAEVVFGSRELSGGSVGVSERAQAKLVELVSAGVLGGGARVLGIAYMLICDLDGVTDRLEFWVRLADGVLGVPVDRLMERTTPVVRHPGSQLIGVEQRAGGQAGDVAEDGLPASGPTGEVLAGRIDLGPTCLLYTSDAADE